MTMQELSTKELEAKIVEELGKQPVQFEQKDMEFGMPNVGQLLKTKGQANLLIMAVGAALSGTVGGIVSGVTGGLGLAIAGLPQTLAGAVLKLTVGKSGGMIADLSDGIILAGISQLVSGVIGTGLGGLAQPFSENVQAQFKQPCECDTTTQERGNVRW